MPLMQQQEKECAGEKWKPDSPEVEEHQQPEILDVHAGLQEANLGLEEFNPVRGHPEQDILPLQEIQNLPLYDADLGTVVEVKVGQDPLADAGHRRERHE